MRLFFSKFFLSPKGPPFHFLHFKRNLQNRPRLKGPPFWFFRHCATFFERKNFSKISSFFPKKMFCAFWALDIAPTLDVPVLLHASSKTYPVCNCLFKKLKNWSCFRKVYNWKVTTGFTNPKSFCASDECTFQFFSLAEILLSRIIQTENLFWWTVWFNTALYTWYVKSSNGGLFGILKYALDFIRKVQKFVDSMRVMWSGDMKTSHFNSWVMRLSPFQLCETFLRNFFHVICLFRGVRYSGPLNVFRHWL